MGETVARLEALERELEAERAAGEEAERRIAELERELAARRSDDARLAVPSSLARAPCA